ncbi:hypothetical protein IMZ11_02720 [Microtetraspora sp. AC03309]|nr:hypothetical protein [Microtetraspora sp. AC03309]MCC5574553.1 hypothetical protein [Microtetraspora sp. AC03309]
MIEIPAWLAVLAVVAIRLHGGTRAALYLATFHKPYTSPKHARSAA